MINLNKMYRTDDDVDVEYIPLWNKFYYKTLLLLFLSQIRGYFFIDYGLKNSVILKFHILRHITKML